jgi:hypothetical protein
MGCLAKLPLFVWILCASAFAQMNIQLISPRSQDFTHRVVNDGPEPMSAFTFRIERSYASGENFGPLEPRYSSLGPAIPPPPSFSTTR